MLIQAKIFTNFSYYVILISSNQKGESKMLEKIIAFFMSIISFLASLFGIEVFDTDLHKYENLSYGTHERQVLDLYFPEDTDGEIGLVLSIHGGAWIGGDKSAYTDMAKSLAKEQGIAAATINYRYLSEETTMFDILDDIEAAVKCIKETALEQGVNINAMITTGHSAGAHLAMLYAYARNDVSAIRAAAVVDYAGPTDMLDENFFINNDLGTANVEMLISWATGEKITQAAIADFEQQLKEISPLYYVNENTVPTIINHGSKDTTVPYSNAVSLAEAFKNAGAEYIFNTYPNSGHGLGEDKEINQTAENQFREYINKYLK